VSLDILQLVSIVIPLTVAITGVVLTLWKHRKHTQQARVSRILQPLRDIQYRLERLKVMYEEPHQDTHLHFCSELDQLNQIIHNTIVGRGLSYDIRKESKSMKNRLLDLNIRCLDVKEEYRKRKSLIRSDDVDSQNRLFDEYRMQLFKDEQIKYLVYQLVYELEKWLLKHS